MKYVVKHGCIACVIKVNNTDFIYFADGKQPGLREPNDKVWLRLPVLVRDAVIAQFKEIFDCPVEDRQAFIETTPSFELDVQPEPSAVEFRWGTQGVYVEYMSGMRVTAADELVDLSQVGVNVAENGTLWFSDVATARALLHTLVQP